MAEPRYNALYPRQSDALVENWAAGTRPETLSAYQEPWYRALPNYLTGLVHGPDSTMAQANSMRHLAGTENPLNLPGQFSEGLDTAAQGYKLGNPTMTGAGLFQAMSSLPIPGFKGAGHAVKQEARPVANALMPKEAGRPRVAVPPPLGAQQESKVSWPLGEGNASTVRLSSVPDWLDRIGVPYEREASKSISDNFGPSLSSYFHIETPSGKKTIRVSDHDYLAPHGGLDFRLGSSADEAIAEIHRLVGRDVPDDVAGRLSAAKAAKEAADRLKDADRWRSTKPAFREQVEAWLKSNGAGYLIENPSAAWAAVQAHRNYSKESRAHALKEIIEKFKPTDTPTSNFLMSQEAKGIRAYHGSPHDFDKFDTSKIGSGEGAQAYGHGLYFAESEGVAESYRSKLSTSKNLDIIANNMTSDPVARVIDRAGGDIGAAISMTEDALSKLAESNPRRKFVEQTLAELKSGKTARESVPFTNGRMYEVNINADPEHFLDWDKPLSQQSEKVRNALQSVGVEPKDRGQFTVVPSASGNRWTVKNVWGESSGSFASKEAAEAKAAEGTAKHNAGSVQAAYTALGGNTIFSRNGMDVGAASRKLNEAGIPGIRYLDQGSRTAGEGSRNYVVFDAATIEILRKYGLLPPMLAAGAAGAGSNALYDGTNNQ